MIIFFEEFRFFELRNLTYIQISHKTDKSACAIPLTFHCQYKSRVNVSFRTGPIRQNRANTEQMPYWPMILYRTFTSQSLFEYDLRFLDLLHIH